MNEQYLGHAPSYKCPGCFTELSAENAALAHFNLCTALRSMIASSGGYAVRNTVEGKQKAVLRDGGGQSSINGVAAARTNHWKVRSPVLSVSVENASPVGMNSPAPMEPITDDGLPILPSSVKPNLLLDVLKEEMSLASDAALARMLRVPMDVIYKRRSGKQPIDQPMLKRMHEASGIPLQELHALMAEAKLSAPTWQQADKTRRRSATPHRLLDAVLEKMNLQSDAALARMLEIAPTVISKRRNGKLPIGRRVLSRLHKATAIPIQELHALLAEMNLPIPTVSPMKKAVKLRRHATPHRLLDALIEKMHLKNDTALVKLLAVDGATISKLRHRKLPIGPAMLTRMHEKTGIAIRELHALLVEMNLPIPTTPAVVPRKKMGRPRNHALSHSVKPHRLLDALIEKMSLTSDTALAKTLQLDPNTIYCYRHGKTPITPRTLIRMHQASDIPMQKLYALMAEMNPPIPTVSPKKQAIKPHRRVKPHRLLDALIEKMNLENDTALAKMLGVNPPTISKLRNGKLPIGASMLIRMHETTDIPIRELRALMSDDAGGQDHGTAFAGANKPASQKLTHEHDEYQKYLAHLVQYPR